MSRFPRGYLLLAALIAGCGHAGESGSATGQVLHLATTTSTRDSGLLDVLIPVFEKEHGARVNVIAVGTGKALKLGETGDVDVVFVHARAAEKAFMEAGHGARRDDVMYNKFEILGPRSDPAATGEASAVEALKKIAAGKHRFVSRGDDSGTHKRELSLWKAAGGRPEWGEYFESGQGMGATLTMADQMNAYVLADHATYLNFKNKIELVPLVTSGEDLNNPYGIMTVNPQKHPGVKSELADAFVDFVISAEAQRMIRDYKIEGEQLFYPLRLPE